MHLQMSFCYKTVWTRIAFERLHLQMDTVHESTNGHNDRIPTVQGKKQTNYGFDENLF